MGFLAALTRRRLLGGAAGALALGPQARAWPQASAPAVAVERDPAVPPRLDLVLELRASIGPAVVLGDGAEGHRRMVPITGGRFEGPRLRGEVLPGGGDWQLVRGDGVTTTEARCTLRVDDGSLLSLTSRTILLPEGECAAGRVRTLAEFDAPRGAHDWLNRAVLVGSLDALAAVEGQVLMRLFRVS